MSQSWTLAICTYNRPQILRRALRTTLQQTRLPNQIVVVDASDDWASTWQAIRDEGLTDVPGIEWDYAPAEIRGLACQRNQSIRAVTSDVVMLFDDDTLLYPDCAEAMMRVYEADEGGVLAGVQARRVPEPPDTDAQVGPNQAISDQADPPSGKGQVPRAGRLWKRAQDWFGMTRYLLAYEPMPERALPDELSGMGLTIHHSFRGAVMSYRTEVIREVGFEEALQRYSYLEDADASQRAARHGLLVEAYEARACHLEEHSGREGRYPVIVMGGTNAMLLHRLHAQDPEASRRAYRKILSRRSWYLLAKDVKARDFSFAGWRGTREARSVCDKIFDLPLEALRAWYAEYQSDLWERKS